MQRRLPRHAEQTPHGFNISPPVGSLDIPAPPGVFAIVDELRVGIVDEITKLPNRPTNLYGPGVECLPFTSAISELEEAPLTRNSSPKKDRVGRDHGQHAVPGDLPFREVLPDVLEEVLYREHVIIFGV